MTIEKKRSLKLLVGVLAFGVFILGITEMAQRNISVSKTQSPATVLLRDYVAGKPVPRIAFSEAFELMGGGINDRNVELVAEQLKIPPGDVLELIKQANQSVVYVGSKDKIPAVLRSVASPEVMPTAQPGLVVEALIGSRPAYE